MWDLVSLPWDKGVFKPFVVKCRLHCVKEKHGVISVIIIHELNIVKRNGVDAKIPKRARLLLT